MRTFKSGKRLLAAAGLIALTGLAPLSHSAAAQTASPLDKINHVIVIYQENWSFDSLYGEFPGANGIANAGATATAGRQERPALRHAAAAHRHQPEARRPRPALPGQPAGARRSTSPSTSPPDQKTGDLVHRFYQEQYQIDGGKMDKFVAVERRRRPGDGLLRRRPTCPKASWPSSTRWPTTSSTPRSAARSSTTLADLRLHARLAQRPGRSCRPARRQRRA